MLEREIRVRPEDPGHGAHQPARAEVGDEAQEVARIGIEQAEGRRVMLAARPLAVISNCLERDHQADVVATRPGGLGVDPAALRGGLEERRLLVDEGDETHAECGRHLGEQPRQLQERRHPAAVVVGAGATHDRIVVCAEEQDLVGPGAPGTRHLQVGAAHAMGLVPLARHGVALGRPSLLDEVGGHGQGLGPEHVALADLGAEPAHVVRQGCGVDLRRRGGYTVSGPRHDRSGYAAEPETDNRNSKGARRASTARLGYSRQSSE